MRRRRYMQGSGEPPVIYNETDAEFYYRQTGGGAIIDNSPLVGRFDKIKGNTIAWNQLVQNGDFSDGTTGWHSSSANIESYDGGAKITTTTTWGGISSQNVTNISGHKVYYRVLASSNESGLYLGLNNIAGFNQKIGSLTTNKEWYSAISTITSSNVQSIVVFTQQADKIFYIYCLDAIDLTLIYGSGNEPSTPAQFEADYFKWFGKPLTYEPYDEGSLRSVKMSGIKSVGFNQWNEEWELGGLDANGEPDSLSNRLRSKNFVPCIGGTSYYFKSPTNSGSCFYYDVKQKFISSNSDGFNRVKISPQNARYLKFSIYKSGITTYDNDICINISNTAKNGTYESYWSETRNIPITILTGKVNGQGESVVVFPDCMRGVDDVRDEIYKQGGKTYGTKKRNIVDLGNLTWTLTTRGFFVADLPDSKTGTSMYDKQKCICSKYPTETPLNIYNLTYGISAGSEGVRTKCVMVYDSSYNDAATFKTEMSGVYIDYELATPITYELDGFTLPVSYNCAALGTEEILPENTSTPTSVAPIVDTSYRVGHVAEKPWYGIKWSEDNGQMQRIASNMELHATLPIQSKMKRCMLLDNGSVYKYISDADPFLYEDGTSVKYDGTDGQVMVEVPAYWYTAYKETDENNITWNYLKLYPKGGGQMYSRKIYRGAFEMITDNSDNSAAKGCSVSMLDFASMGTTKDTTSFVASAMKYLSAATSYRNWNYYNVDPTNVKNSLGKPTTNRTRATFRSIAARRGAGFSQEYWDSYNSLIRLYVVEYCNFDIQASINDNLTIEGFKQGGLGAGVTNADSAKWSNFNGYNSFVPCGVTVPLGNKSGAVSYAFTNNDFHNVNITYSVPSYRGIENPFGHIEKFIDGLNRKGKVDNSVTTEMIYVCDIISKFAEDNADGYILQSDTAPRATGNFGGVDWNVKGTFWPKLGGRTMYSGYFYNDYVNNTWYTLTGGSNADAGSNAGLFSLRAYSASSYANDGVGSRLLYTK